MTKRTLGRFEQRKASRLKRQLAHRHERVAAAHMHAADTLEQIKAYCPSKVQRYDEGMMPWLQSEMCCSFFMSLVKSVES